MTHLLGIDLGTSSVKVVVFDAQQARIVAQASRDYPIHKPAPNTAEQNPIDWWRAVIEAVRESVAQVDPTRIAGIGLAGQMHGTVLVNAAGEPVAPAIIWADQRSASVTQSMIERVDAERYTALAGTLPAAGFMASTLVWLADQRPDLLEDTHMALLPKDFIRLRLTGKYGTDISDAASTALLNISSGQWSDEVLHALALPARLLPPIHGSADVIGQLTPSAAQEMGLMAGLPVVAGCADQGAQAVANGLLSPDTASITIGTGGQVFVPVLRASPDTPLPTDPRLHLFNHAAPGLWYSLGAILAAGLSLRWLRDLFGGVSFTQLSAEAADISPGSEGLIFLPYLVGERTPHMDPDARGAFVGLGLHHGRGHLARAVMEGVAFALKQTLDIALQNRPPVTALIGAGGGLSGDVWRGILTDVIGLPLRRTLISDETAIGAALVAGIGVGMYPDYADAAAAVAHFSDPTEPDLRHNRRYSDLYGTFTGLYPALRSDFHRLTHRQQTE